MPAVVRKTSADAPGGLSKQTATATEFRWPAEGCPNGTKVVPFRRGAGSQPAGSRLISTRSPRPVTTAIFNGVGRNWAATTVKIKTPRIPPSIGSCLRCDEIKHYLVDGSTARFRKCATVPGSSHSATPPCPFAPDLTSLTISVGCSLSWT
jgi:hypothetical protein